MVSNKPLVMKTYNSKVNGKEFDKVTKIAAWKKHVDRRDYLDIFGYDIYGK
jgi:hypothetical protein